jgi:hypothetical protein
MVRPALNPGRLLEPVSDCWPRGMTVHDRTRLIGQLHFYLKTKSWCVPSAFHVKWDTSTSAVGVMTVLIAWNITPSELLSVSTLTANVKPGSYFPTETHQ